MSINCPSSWEVYLLLNTHEPPSLGRRRLLTDVDRYLSRLDTDRETVYDTGCDQHADILRRRHDRRADDPASVSAKATPDDGGNADQITQPTMMEVLRPTRSDKKPETRAPSQEPAAIAAVIPPWTRDSGPEQFSLSE